MRLSSGWTSNWATSGVSAHEGVDTMRLTCCGLVGVLLTGFLAGPSLPGPVADGDEAEVFVQTFSIAAVDRASDTCGVAVASKAPKACKSVGHARAGVGAFCTQYYAVPRWGNTV